MTMENYLTTPWVGPSCCRNSLTVAVLSANIDIINIISNALRDVHSTSDIKWKLVVLRSFNIESISNQSDFTGKLSIDFVILALDSSKLFCLEWARKALQPVHPDLKMRRIVLVNAKHRSTNNMAVNKSDIITFCSENNLEMVTADVSKHEDAYFMARRLLKYIEISIGVNTGIPNLNVSF